MTHEDAMLKQENAPPEPIAVFHGVVIQFHIKEKVRITELQRPGVVIAFYIDTGGVSYKVRYFNDEQAYEVYFFDWELERQNVL